MTGEIDAFGPVWPFGGLELKITAVENEDRTRFLVPLANYQQLVEADKLGKYKCEINSYKQCSGGVQFAIW